MRLAASQGVYDQLAGRVNAQKAIAHVEAISEMYEMLRAGGLGDEAAMQHAARMVQGQEPMAAPSIRFAAIYGDTSGNAA